MRQYNGTAALWYNVCSPRFFLEMDRFRSKIRSFLYSEPALKVQPPLGIGL